MLRAIEFNNDRFKKEDCYNVLYPISKNTIILCNNTGLMHSLADEIIKTVNGEAEYNDYDCDEKDIGKAKSIFSFGLQEIIDINGQHITLAIEPSIIYKANRMKDIWFFDYIGKEDDETNPYKEFIYPLFIFKGSREAWKTGKDEIYKMICSGNFGTYDGKWANLKQTI